MKRRAKAVHLPWTDYVLIAVCSAALLALTWAGISSPNIMLFGDIVARVTTNEKVVALTFDDGPLPVHTEETLAFLKQADVKATFFIIGKEALAHEAELKALVASGNALGNHSYSHRMMAFMPSLDVQQEVEVTDTLLRDAGYTGSIPFRAPYNLKFVSLALYLDSQHRPDISRDVITNEGYQYSAETIASSIVAQVKPGSIVLLHPMYDHTATSRAAIPLIVSELKKNGYRFVTIPELLTYR